MNLGKVLGINKYKKISTGFSQSIHREKWRKKTLSFPEIRKLSIFTDSMIIINF
jgi:hypothetical protein